MGPLGSIAILAVVAFIRAQSTVVTQNSGLGPLPVRVIAGGYPLLAHLAGVQGDVQLAVTVSMTGRVQNVRVVSGAGLLNDAAAAMVSRWVFTPCEDSTKGCEPRITVHYVLEPGLCGNSECPTEFQFDLPATVTVRSKHRPAIVN